MKIKPYFERIKDNKYIFASITNCIVLICMVLLFYARYNCELDIIMQGLLYGIGEGGWSSAHLLFSNIFLGSILSTITRMLPSLPWYTIFHYMIIFISLVIIDVIIMKNNNNYIGKILSMIVSVFIGYECYIMPMYMKTAALATCTTTLLIAYNLFQKKYKKRTTRMWSMISIVLFGIVASWISFSTFIAVFLISSLSIVLFGLFNKKRFRNKLSMRNSVVILLVITIFCNLIDESIYEHSEIWGKVGKYRESIEKLGVLGFPAYSDIENLLEKDGYLEIDESYYENLKNGIYFDVEEDIKLLNKIAEYKYDNKNDFLSFFRNFSAKVFSTGIFYLWLMIVLLLIYTKSKKVCLINIAVSFLEIGVLYFNIYTYTAYDIQWIELLIYMPAIIYLLLNEFGVPEKKDQYLWVYLGIFGILLFNTFSNKFIGNIEKNEEMKDIIELQNNENYVQIIDFNYYIQGFTIYKPYPKCVDVENVFLANGVYQIIPGFRNLEDIVQNEKGKFNGCEIYGRDYLYTQSIAERIMSNNSIKTEEFLDSNSFHRLSHKVAHKKDKKY